MWEAFIFHMGCNICRMSGYICCGPGTSVRKIRMGKSFEGWGNATPTIWSRDSQRFGCQREISSLLPTHLLKIQASSLSISTRLSLALAVKGINDTAGPSAIVETLLVLGITLRLSVLHAAVLV